MQPERGAREQQLEEREQMAATTTETIAIFRISTPPMSHGWLSGPIDDAMVPSCPNASTAMLCMRNAMANVATSITAGECVRSGRNTIDP